MGGEKLLALAAEKQGSKDEEGRAGAAEKNDGVTVGCLDGGGCGAGAVETLSTALEQGHWPNSKRRKRKTQRIPMTCQYQTVVSTNTWRVERERENLRAARATMRATMPRTRCTAWVMVMR
jgi:hypothetical protein